MLLIFGDRGDPRRITSERSHLKVVRKQKLIVGYC